MSVRHDRSSTKKTGGKTRSYRKSRKYDLGSEFSSPSLGDTRTEKKSSRGNTEKNVVRTENKANIPVDGQVKNVDIDSVEDNPANDNYVRRSLLTKGTIIQTSEGEARITSRPGQDGVINAELLEN